MTTPKRSWKAARRTELVPGRHVIERLGGGTRTEVYRCTDAASEHPVVVKLLRPGRTRPTDRTALTRERDVLATLDHPAFPRLIDDDLEATPAWIVMTQVDGPHVSHLLREFGPLAVDQLLPLATDVAAGLAHLHERGYVHLDIKPANIVLGTTVVVLDLGAAHRIDDTARLPAGHGTVTYLAPEQARPDELGPPGPPADVFGLGMTLLRAATGENPLAARRKPDAPDDAVLVARCRDAADGAPRELAALIRACLAFDPAERPTAADITEVGTGHRRARSRNGLISRMGASMRGFSAPSHGDLTSRS